MQSDSKFLTTKDVAKFLHISEKAVYSLVSEKGLPASKVTGKWIFPKRLVEEWVESHIEGALGFSKTGSSEDGALLIAGSDDPLFKKTVSLFHSRSSDMTVFYANVGSMGGVNSLKRGLCHIGVCHLLQDDQQEYNFDFAAKELRSPPVIVNFSKRQQGLLVARSNPKDIRTIADLSRDDVTMVNRSLGTGTRLLLDYEISKSNIKTKEIKGYANEVSAHLDAGIEVFSGRADVAPCISAVAGLLDLDFIPLRWERFDLIISRERFFERGIQSFLGLLHEEPFQNLASSFTGYDISLCGKMVFPEKLHGDE